LGLRERIAIGVAVITAVGVVVAALVRILPDMIK
jgi:hypothetical protein